MKILVFGPRDRYDVYRPPFADEMPVELVFRRPDQTYVQAAQENADARIIFVDAITDVGPDVMDQLPELKMIHSEGVGYNCIDCQAARERGLAHEEMHSQVEYLVAHGIASTVGGEKVIIGSAHFVFEDEHCAIPDGEQEKFDALPPEYSHLYLAIAGQLSAVICIADPLRKEAAQVIQTLRELGVKKTVMLTGDSERTAAAIAAQVGVDEYHSEVLPEDKASFVQQERALGHTVIMLGDGINDSPALSAADVGIAISDGAAIAREIADVTIAADSLRELVLLKSIANGLQKRTKSNYRFIMSFNSTLIVLGAMGILPPATSALLHNASTLGVSLKSMTNLLD